MADFNATYASLAPAAIGAPRYAQVDSERYEQCVAETADYPLLRELESAEHGNLSNPRFYNWFTVKPAKSATKISAVPDRFQGCVLEANYE